MTANEEGFAHETAVRCLHSPTARPRPDVESCTALLSRCHRSRSCRWTLANSLHANQTSAGGGPYGPELELLGARPGLHAVRPTRSH